MQIQNKRAQLTIFIIIAIVLVGGIVVYFAFLNKTPSSRVVGRFAELESYYSSCIEELGTEAITAISDKGGWLEEPEFVSGNALEPLSSRLGFFGFSISYWMYIKNNEIFSQAPTKALMEEQLARFIGARLSQCQFEDFAQRGFIIQRENPSVKVSIQKNYVDFVVNEDITYSIDGETERFDKHSVRLNSELGNMYEKAVEIFNSEMQGLFLENYTIDVLRLYAPVDGVEISCAPKIWKENQIYDNIKKALQTNMQELRLENPAADFNEEDNVEKYFTIKGVDSDGLDVKFMYSPLWITRMDATPSDDGLMIAEPVGNQEGLGILGFCYVPYHFVYDIDFPVLIQIFSSKSNEIFQFPVQSIIRSNKQRKALPTLNEDLIELDVCKYKVKPIEIYTYNSDSEPVEADVSFKCVSSGCELGRTKIESTSDWAASLKTNAPQCVNAFLVASAEGYENAKFQISTNSQTAADIMLKKIYEINLELLDDFGNEITDFSTIYFRPSGADKGEKEVRVVVWPEQKTIRISEGEYNISVHSYKNSTIKIPSTSTSKCVDVPRPGFAGFFGMTKEQCYNIDVPEQILSNAINAGGNINQYISESELQLGDKIVITAKKFKTPTSILELQDAYGFVDASKLQVSII